MLLTAQEENVPSESNKQHWISTFNRFHPHHYSRLHKSHVNNILLKWKIEQQRNELQRVCHREETLGDASGISERTPRRWSALWPYRHNIQSVLLYPPASKPCCALESLACLTVVAVSFLHLSLFQSRWEYCHGIPEINAKDLQKAQRNQGIIPVP